MRKPTLSYYTYIVCAIIMTYAMCFFYPRWNANTGEQTFQWDAGHYYSYLPALFIYKDIKTLHKTDSVRVLYGFEPGVVPQSDEHTPKVITYSSGMAVLHFPAFIVAHNLASNLGYPQDGFSKPYQFFVQLFALFGAILGLWYFRKLLLHFYSDATSAITLGLLVIGTNYLNYATVDVAITHSWLFTLYTLLIWHSIRFYQSPNYKSAVYIGAIYGLMILIRPSEIIAIIIPLLWSLNDLKLSSIKTRISFLFSNSKLLIISVALTLLIGSIQVAYWYHVTGKLIYYSYQFGFSWDGRHLYNYLFSWGSGWLMYNPVISFSMIGLLVLAKKGQNRVAIILFSIISLYIVSAWNIWWYSGIGGRAMIQSYPIYFLALALFVQEVSKTKYLKVAFAGCSLLFVYLNLWFFYNAHSSPSLYNTLGMSGAYYRAVVGKFNVHKDVIKLKDTDEIYTGKVNKSTQVYYNNFDDDTAALYTEHPLNGEKSLRVNKQNNHSPTYPIIIKDRNKDWLRVSADIKHLSYDWNVWNMTQLIVRFMSSNNQQVKSNIIRVNRISNPHSFNNIYFDVSIPEENFERAEVLFWTPEQSSDDIIVDNLTVHSFNE